MRSTIIQRRRHGFTLIEMTVVLFLIGILTATAGERFIRIREIVAVHQAATETEAVFTRARQLAMTEGVRTTVEIDTASDRLMIRRQNQVVEMREIGTPNEVTMQCSRNGVTYAATGLGVGVSNLTLVLAKGSARDTLTVSRLGRVKRAR